MNLSREAQIIDGVLYIPQGVTEIDYYEFAQRTDFNKVVFPDTLKQIWDGAFCGCTNLTEIVLPDSLRKISRGAFRNTGLRALTLPPELKKVAGACGNGAFADCSALEKLTVLGNRVQFKPDWGAVFENCPNLQDAQIPLKVWKRNYRKHKWPELYHIPPLGGVPSVDIFRLLLEDRTRRVLKKKSLQDSPACAEDTMSVQADLSWRKYGATYREKPHRHHGELYTLSVSLSGGMANQKVQGFEIDVLLCQDKLELLDIQPCQTHGTSAAELVLNGKGSYYIDDVFTIGPSQTATRHYSVAHRPWDKDLPVWEQNPALLALYCFRIRPVFADDAGDASAGPWSSWYVCALGPGLGYNLCDIQYNWHSGLKPYFDIAAANFLRLGRPLGPQLTDGAIVCTD